MTKNIIAIVIALVVVALGFSAYYFLALDKSPLDSDLLNGEEFLLDEEEVVLPDATSDIDGIIDALLLEASGEEKIAAEQDNDAELITSDSQEVGDFNQSVKEDEL
jgi:hypothetical protein